MSAVHKVFHVSMLKKHIPDATQVIEPRLVQVRDDLSYDSRLIQIIDRAVKKLRNKEVSLVKVSWQNHTAAETTWETEASMRQKYPELF